MLRLRNPDSGTGIGVSLSRPILEDSREEAFQNFLNLIDRLHPEWHQRAACRGQTDAMFSVKVRSVRKAAALCSSCPVRDECRRAGESEHHGVWGGELRGNRGGPDKVRLVDAVADCLKNPAGAWFTTREVEFTVGGSREKVLESLRALWAEGLVERQTFKNKPYQYRWAGKAAS